MFTASFNVWEVKSIHRTGDRCPQFGLWKFASNKLALISGVFHFRSFTTIAKYAQYQANSFQESLKVKQQSITPTS